MSSKFKYLGVFILPTLTYIAFTSYGISTFAPVIFFFLLVPILELFFNPNTDNFNEVQKQIKKDDKFYDWLLYTNIPIHLGFLIIFLLAVQDAQLTTSELIGRILSMGMMCGLIGINLGHEIGHRTKLVDKLLSNLLLLTSLENHFAIYHNYGHHRNVATYDDPATARRGEMVYVFWIRSQITGYFQAWEIERKILERKGLNSISIQNRMILYTVSQLSFVTVIYLFFGIHALLSFISAAIIGIILLETVNYIEHYGLLRKMIGPGIYEQTSPIHSWNSDHIIGRMLLFELSRHSDHHYKAEKRYQILDSIEKSPQMPTGYPGMMILSLIPPVWFMVMHDSHKLTMSST